MNIVYTNMSKTNLHKYVKLISKELVDLQSQMVTSGKSIGSGTVCDSKYKMSNEKVTYIRETVEEIQYKRLQTENKCMYFLCRNEVSGCTAFSYGVYNNCFQEPIFSLYIMNLSNIYNRIEKTETRFP